MWHPRLPQLGMSKRYFDQPDGRPARQVRSQKALTDRSWRVDDPCIKTRSA